MLAKTLRAEAKQMRIRTVLPAEPMWDGLYVALVAIAERYDEAAARIEELERLHLKVSVDLGICYECGGQYSDLAGHVAKGHLTQSAHEEKP